MPRIFYRLAQVAIGCAVGFTVSLSVLNGDKLEALRLWSAANLGWSIWAFAGCLLLFALSLSRLSERLADGAPYAAVVQADQLSDLWIHVFVGIGVIWTAIGMRAALVSTLENPASTSVGAGQILAQLVDGGILLALSTTIVGAAGGYLMRLFKTCLLGTKLSACYQTYDRADLSLIVAHLENIDARLGHTRPAEQPVHASA